MGDLEAAMQRAGANLGIVPEGADPAASQGSIEWGDDGTGIATFLAEAGRDEPVTLDAAEAALNRFAGVMLGPESPMLAILDIVEVTLWGWNPATDSPYRRFKAKISRPRGVKEQAAIERIVERSTSLRARKPAAARKTGQPGDWIVGWYDCQTGKGKGERFGSTVEMVDRTDWFIDEGLPAEHRRLTRSGTAVETAHLILGGDTTEGVMGSYDHQAYKVEMNVAEQLEVATGIVHRALDRLCGLAPRVRVTGMSSNHDRVSAGSGKTNITDDWDDRTFTVLRTLARIVDSNPDRYGQVEVVLPKDPLVAVVRDVQGLDVAALHGHKPKYAVSARETMLRWHNGQVSSRTPGPGRCQLILSGHYHHRFMVEDSGRTFVGFPSMDGGSQYLTDEKGTWSMPGLRTLAVSDGAVSVSDMVFPGDAEVARETFGRVAL